MNADIDIRRVVLKTKRLKLRSWQTDDLDDLYAYASVRGVGEMAGWPHHVDKEESKAVLIHFIADHNTFAITSKDKVIGSIGIGKYDEKKLPEFEYLKGCELGFVLAKDQWGQGLMPEALRAVINYLFTDHDIDFITCGYFIGNTRSMRVQEKLGFHKYKINDNFLTKTGSREVVQINILFKEEWLDDQKIDTQR